MSRGSARFVHLAVLAAGGTGLVYAWMCWLAVPEDEFAVVNHTWQPDLQAWHIVAAPLLVFAVGLLWRSHVWGKLIGGQPERRRTGLSLALLFVPMTLSGYLLQVAIDETWRAVWVWAHGTTGVAWVLVYLAHQFSRRSRRARASTGSPAGE